MKRIKKFGSFELVNESALIEGKAYYTGKGYISDPNIADYDVLKSKIEAEITPAWNEFAKSHNIPITGSKMVIEGSGRSTYIQLQNDEIEPKNLGIFANVLKSCKFSLFSGREVQYATEDGEFLFNPVIWSTLNLSYESKGGGSNGMKYIFTEGVSERYGADRGSEMWYNILEGKFYDFNEMLAKEAAEK